MITRTKQEDSVVEVNLGQILNDLMNWQSELSNSPDDAIRYSMIDSFEDLIFDHVNE